MAGMKDFFGAFEGFKPGQTKPGTWRTHEAYGRLTGAGAVSGELELPEGKAIVGIEDHATVEDLELELTGADGEPVALKRFDERHRGGERGVHNLHRLGEGEIGNPGLHHIRVKSPDAGEEMIVVVGYEQGVGDALMDVAPGAKLFRRLRGG